MPFEPRKYGDIFEAMRASSAAAGVVTDFETGSVARTLCESFAYEAALLYEKMRLVYLSAYVDTAEGQQLDMVVAVLGIARGEPDYAQGVVTFHRDVGNDDAEAPAGTLVATVDKPGAPKKVYLTVERTALSKGQTSADARVQAVNRGETETAPAGAVTVMPRPVPGIKSVSNTAAITFTGKKGETDSQLRERAKNALISSGKATVVAIENALLSLPDVDDARVIERPDVANNRYGLIDVFVDGVDLNDPAKNAEVTAAVDRVRAAGIFARVQSTTALAVEAVFQIAPTPGLKLAQDERADLEAKVAQSVQSYIAGLKMGDSLLLSQIVKNILAVDGVADLAQYAITVNGAAAFPGDARSHDAGPAERFKASLICAASEDKPLPIGIRFKATAGLTAASLAALKTALAAYLGALARGTTVPAAELLKRIVAAGIAADAGSLEIAADSWCGDVRFSGKDVIPKFVEQPALGEVFAYSNLLKITGALRLVLSPQLTQTQQSAVQSQVAANIAGLLAALKSDADVVFADLAAAAKSVDLVQDAQLNTGDFSVRLDGAAAILRGRVTDKKIDVQAFERAQLEFFCVTGSIRTVNVAITGLKVTVTVPGHAPTGQALTDAQNQVINGLAGKPLLPGLAAGQDVAYNSLRGAIEGLMPGAGLTATGMTLTATSECDGRSQTAVAPGTSIHVRSVEAAGVKPVDAAAIAVTVRGTEDV